MDFIIQNWYLVALAVVSGGMLLFLSSSGGGGTGLAVQDAVTLMNQSRAYVIDIREESEFAQGHIGNARNVPLKDLESKLAQTVKNKKLPVIFVCDRGSRGSRAIAIAKKMGYESPNNLKGGFRAWVDASMPIEKK